MGGACVWRLRVSTSTFFFSLFCLSNRTLNTFSKGLKEVKGFEAVNRNMHTEASVAADFLAKLMARRVSDDQLLDRFRDNFVRRFEEKFAQSWPTPDEALRGSGNRCIRCASYRIDPFLAEVLDVSGIGTKHKHLFPEITVWIDPVSVCYRMGDSSSINALYGDSDSSASDSLPSSPENSPIKTSFMQESIIRGPSRRPVNGNGANMSVRVV